MAVVQEEIGEMIYPFKFFVFNETRLKVSYRQDKIGYVRIYSERSYYLLPMTADRRREDRLYLAINYKAWSYIGTRVAQNHGISLVNNRQ